jgi:hypothetical protein
MLKLQLLKIAATFWPSVDTFEIFSLGRHLPPHTRFLHLGAHLLY